MKKLITTIISSVSLLLLCSLGCRGINKKAAHMAEADAVYYCTLTSDESQFNFGYGYDHQNKYMFRADELDSAVSRFNANFKYRKPGLPPEILKNDPDSIKVSEIAKPIDDVATKMNGQSGYFKALAIHYGIQNKRMVLIYEPMALTNYHKVGEVYNCDTVFTKKYYKSNNMHELELIRNSLADSLIEAYHDSIWIHHINQPTVDSFIYNDDANISDIYYCVMPIQQIIRMSSDNLNCQPDDLIYFQVGADSVYNFALFQESLNLNSSTSGTENPIALQEYESKNFKLHVIAYTSGIRTSGFGENFNGLGADFGQMCPPNCGYVQVPPVQ